MFNPPRKPTSSKPTRRPSLKRPTHLNQPRCLTGANCLVSGTLVPGECEGINVQFLKRVPMKLLEDAS